MTNLPLKFSWTAVLVGALVGFALNFLLNLLSLAIGISLFSEKIKGSLEFSAAGLIGFLIVAICSMLFCGWVAGKLTNYSQAKKIWGTLIGLVAWCLSFIMTVILLMNMIQFTYFHSNFTSKELTAIRISNQTSMMTETQGVNTALDKKIITLNAYLTFLLFLTGCLSSCLGGYLGYQPENASNINFPPK